MPPSGALVLFDIDGTLVRKSGPQHCDALIEAVRRATGLETSTGGIPLQGMLDRDILTAMLRNAGASRALIRARMQVMVEHAQDIYVQTCPNLEDKVCPGVRPLLEELARGAVPTGLVTGNLTRIGWKKMERAGLREFFQFGAFAEMASSRAGLVRIALRHARKHALIHPLTRISLIGDHPNDVMAAKKNGIRSIAVGTGVVAPEELAACAPDHFISDLSNLVVEELF